MIMPHPCHCHKYTLRSRSTRHTFCILFTASDILFSSLPSLIVCQFVMCSRKVKGLHACRGFFAVSVSQLPSRGPMSITHSVCFLYPRLAVHPSIHPCVSSLPPVPSLQQWKLQCPPQDAVYVCDQI